jgi:hypothetical protein
MTHFTPDLSKMRTTLFSSELRVGLHVQPTLTFDFATLTLLSQLYKLYEVLRYTISSIYT